MSSQSSGQEVIFCFCEYESQTTINTILSAIKLVVGSLDDEDRVTLIVYGTEKRSHRFKEVSASSLVTKFIDKKVIVLENRDQSLKDSTPFICLLDTMKEMILKKKTDALLVFFARYDDKKSTLKRMTVVKEVKEAMEKLGGLLKRKVQLVTSNVNYYMDLFRKTYFRPYVNLWEFRRQQSLLKVLKSEFPNLPREAYEKMVGTTVKKNFKGQVSLSHVDRIIQEKRVVNLMCRYARMGEKCPYGDRCHKAHCKKEYDCHNWIETGECSWGENCKYAHVTKKKGMMNGKRNIQGEMKEANFIFQNVGRRMDREPDESDKDFETGSFSKYGKKIKGIIKDCQEKQRKEISFALRILRKRRAEIRRSFSGKGNKSEGKKSEKDGDEDIQFEIDDDVDPENDK